MTAPRALAGGEALVMGEAGEFRLEQPTAGLLYGYQVEGLQWMWRLWSMPRPARGGICGDDMGLGKARRNPPSLLGTCWRDGCHVISRAAGVVPSLALAVHVLTFVKFQSTSWKYTRACHTTRGRYCCRSSNESAVTEMQRLPQTP